MQDMYSVGSLGRLPIMHHVGHQVVGGVLLCHLGLFSQVLTKIHVAMETASAEERSDKTTLVFKRGGGERSMGDGRNPITGWGS